MSKQEEHTCSECLQIDRYGTQTFCRLNNKPVKGSQKACKNFYPNIRNVY